MVTTNLDYRIKIEAERRSRGKRCHICGKYQSVGEFAHRVHSPDRITQKQKGEGRGKNNRTIGIIRHPENYVLLCSDCHRVYDLKYNYHALYDKR